MRRHSVSIIDRAPPPADSLAAVILANNLAVRSSLLSSIADMKDSLSDFNSCVESQSTSDTSDTSDASEEELGSLKGVPKTANEKKRAKKERKKRKLTPGKEQFSQFLKKPNTHHSPK